ncbi:MAG TPA: peptide ABC transporter substrate-binding protein [Candidatus Baltobacteraceae bacterium]|nr:peptide ABC transporter substrate-binding protein [Candidatus Baltobacteraceae bacterium]
MRAYPAALFLLCAALGGCRSGGYIHETPQRLLIADQREPISLNSILLEGPSAATLDPLIYSYLLEYDEHGNLVPDLAVEVPTKSNGGISADGLTVKYHLRSNAKWQDGVPVTARDVAFTFHAILNPKNNVFSRYGYDRVRDVSAVDVHTVRVRLRVPYSPITSNFFAPDQNYGILPEHLLAAYPDLNQVPFNAKPIGSGPYRVVEWDRGDRLTLRRNTLYFRGTPPISSITLKFIANSNTVLNQLRTREVNAYFFADPEHLQEYRAIAGAAVVRAPFAGFGVLVFNTADRTIAEPEVRRALVQALNLTALVRNATRNTQEFDNANRGLFSWAYDSSATPQPYDARAAKLVLQAHHIRALTLIYESGIATSSSVAVQLQRQLQAAGVDVALRAYTPQMFRAPGQAGGPLFGGKFQLAFVELYNTVDPNTQWVLSCSQIPPNGFNTSHFCDAPTERANEEDLQTYDRGLRVHYASIVQHRLVSQVPLLSLWADNAIYVVPSNLSGFAPSPTSPYWNVWQWRLNSH